MKAKSRVFVTDCEGPVSKNDNAFELTCLFIPDGDRFFKLISLYDDVLTDIVKKNGYKAGDTLRLILPFLRAYGATDEKMRIYSSKNILLVPGAKETLRYVMNLMPSFIVSTSYEYYIDALCEAIGFTKENAYCTRVTIDNYELDKNEEKRLQALRAETSQMSMIEIPKGARALEDLSPETQNTVDRLGEVFWEEIYHMSLGRMLKEVNPIGGHEKARAIREIAEKNDVNISDILYVGDSITDVEPFRLVRNEGGLAVSFNGNQYAIRESEVAIMAHHAIITAILAEIFRRHGRERVIELTEEWDLSLVKHWCSSSLFDLLMKFSPERPPRIERITQFNMDRLISESSTFRKAIRGEAIGSLG